jgi:hypothetical protein
MKINLQLVLLITIFTCACKPDLSNPKIEEIYKEVMVIHDEVMPEISTIHKLKKKIRKIDDKSSVSLELIKKLDDADESMMSWMAEFGKFRSMNKAKDEEKITYLKNEKEKINEISKMMKQAISEGMTYLSTKN